MTDRIDILKNPAHVARERAKGRELRDTPWWRQALRRGVCHYCGRAVGAAALTMDHVIPVARGGRSAKANVVPACRACNQAKRALTPAERILDTLEPPKVEERPQSSGFSACPSDPGRGALP